MKGKKGISPLISVILVVALAITIGAMVITWTTDFSRDTADYVNKKTSTERKCSMDVSFDFWVREDGCRAICYNDSNVYFTLTNKGDEPLEGFKSTVMASGGESKTVTLNNTDFNETFPMKKADTQRFNISFGELGVNGSDLELVRIYAVVGQGKDEIVCTNHDLIERRVLSCYDSCYN